MSGSIIRDDIKILTYLDIYISSICFFSITKFKFNRITVIYPLQNKHSYQKCPTLLSGPIGRDAIVYVREYYS